MASHVSKKMSLKDIPKGTLKRIYFNSSIGISKFFTWCLWTYNIWYNS